MQIAQRYSEVHGLYRGQKKPMLCIGHDFTDCGKTHALYQGTTLVGPLGLKNDGL
jgi:hypothetical protein